MTKATHLIALLTGCFTLAACGLPKDRVRIEGKFNHISQAEFYVYSEDGAIDGMDTVRIEDGEFTYERHLTDTAVLTLLYPNFSEMYVVAVPGATIKMEGDAGRLGEMAVSGTHDNEELTNFRLQQLHKPDGDIRLAAAEYIRSHSASQAAVVLFKQYFAKDKQADATTSLSLLETLRKARPNDLSVTSMSSMLAPLLRNSVGRKMKPFKAKDLNGKTIDSDSYRGKPLLIAFWASWNSDCLVWLDLLRRYEKLYGDKMSFLHISLDADIERCRSQVETDTLRSPVVCDGGAFASPLISQLGVRYLPDVMIVDASGTIVARNLQENELRDAIEKAVH